MRATEARRGCEGPEGICLRGGGVRQAVTEGSRGRRSECGGTMSKVVKVGAQRGRGEA